MTANRKTSEDVLNYLKVGHEDDPFGTGSAGDKAFSDRILAQKLVDALGKDVENLPDALAEKGSNDSIVKDAHTKVRAFAQHAPERQQKIAEAASMMQENEISIFRR